LNPLYHQTCRTHEQILERKSLVEGRLIEQAAAEAALRGEPHFVLEDYGLIKVSSRDVNHTR
jgi:hypothetical protein